MSETDDNIPVGYVDIYLLPIAEDKLEPYQRLATEFGTIVMGFGAKRYREFRGDDLGDSFTAMANGGALTAGVVEFESRQHRDEVMAKAMEHPRVKEMTRGDQLTDMTLMIFGGFEAFVEP